MKSDTKRTIRLSHTQVVFLRDLLFDAEQAAARELQDDPALEGALAMIESLNEALSETG